MKEGKEGKKTTEEKKQAVTKGNQKGNYFENKQMNPKKDENEMMKDETVGEDPKFGKKNEGEGVDKEKQETKGKARKSVNNSSGNEEIAMNVNDDTSLAAERVQTPSKRGVAQERKNGKHQSEKNRKFRESSKFPRSEGKSGTMEEEENKDIIMNEEPMEKNQSDNSKQNDDTIKKPWTIAPAGGIAAKIFTRIISEKSRTITKEIRQKVFKKSPQEK